MGFLAVILTTALIDGGDVRADGTEQSPDLSKPEKSRRYAVLAGIAPPTEPAIVGGGEFYHGDTLTLQSVFLGLTGDIGPHRRCGHDPRGVERVVSLYLDMKIGVPKTGNAKGSYPEQTDTDFTRAETMRMSAGVQCRFIGRSVTPLRPYAGIGMGLYYSSSSIRMYGTRFSYNFDPVTGQYVPVGHYYDVTNNHGRTTIGGKLLIGLEHDKGVFAQVDIAYAGHKESQYDSLTKQIDVGLRLGYRF